MIEVFIIKNNDELICVNADSEDECNRLTQGIEGVDYRKLVGDELNIFVDGLQFAGPSTTTVNGSDIETATVVYNSIDVSCNDLIGKVWLKNKELLSNGIIFDGFRHSISGGHREYISSQYTLIKSGSTSQYGEFLRDSDGEDQEMTDEKLCKLFENGTEYVSLINQVAMSAEDNILLMTQQELNDFDCDNDITWPSNVYTYTP